jgi:hypothetical protein
VNVLDPVSEAGRRWGKLRLSFGSVTAEWTAPATLDVRVGRAGEAFDRCAYGLRARPPDSRLASLPSSRIPALDRELED